MRIIAGNEGGRSLATPSDRSIRPTSSRTREALFSILGNLRDAIVVDGFAGTGACGLEALSRGASHCYFIDASPDAIHLIRENIDRVDAGDNAIILEGKFDEQLKLIADTPDLWLLDPPYGSDAGASALQTMAGSRCVTDRALAVLELDKRTGAPEVNDFEITDRREYGRTQLIFYRYHSDGEA